MNALILRGGLKPAVHRSRLLPPNIESLISNVPFSSPKIAFLAKKGVAFDAGLGFIDELQIAW